VRRGAGAARTACIVRERADVIVKLLLCVYAELAEMAQGVALVA
jgi:hypothetical protein